MAEILIEEQHDIAQTPYDIAFPWLCCIYGCIRRNCISEEELPSLKKNIEERLLEG
jgi:hypothetical protein